MGYKRSNRGICKEGFINSALSTLQEIDGLVVIEGMGESGVHTKNY
ncbi:hypothetical protein LM594_04240 [Candidatus Caldipriscus sp.]|nr:hypothetical protein [Candidatus Caldipriscus sp.]